MIIVLLRSAKRTQDSVGKSSGKKHGPISLRGGANIKSEGPEKIGLLAKVGRIRSLSARRAPFNLFHQRRKSAVYPADVRSAKPQTLSPALHPHRALLFTRDWSEFVTLWALVASRQLSRMSDVNSSFSPMQARFYRIIIAPAMIYDPGDRRLLLARRRAGASGRNLPCKRRSRAARARPRGTAPRFNGSPIAAQRQRVHRDARAREPLALCLPVARLDKSIFSRANCSGTKSKVKIRVH